MSKLGLRTATIEIRGKAVTVREITERERRRLEEIQKSDGKAELFLHLAATGAVDPTYTFDELLDEPRDVAMLIAGEVAKLSNLAGEGDDEEEGEKKD